MRETMRETTGPPAPAPRRGPTTTTAPRARQRVAITGVGLTLGLVVLAVIAGLQSARASAAVAQAPVRTGIAATVDGSLAVAGALTMAPADGITDLTLLLAGLTELVLDDSTSESAAAVDPATGSVTRIPTTDRHRSLMAMSRDRAAPTLTTSNGALLALAAEQTAVAVVLDPVAMTTQVASAAGCPGADVTLVVDGVHLTGDAPQSATPLGSHPNASVSVACPTGIGQPWLLLIAAVTLVGLVGTRWASQAARRLERGYDDLADAVEHATADLRQSNDALRSTAASQQLLYNAIAHELGNASQAVALSRGVDPELRDHAVDQLVDLVVTLRDTVTGRARVLEPDTQPVALDAAVTAAIPVDLRDALDIHIDLSPEIEVLCDPAHLRLILSNLLHNAHRHGGPPIEVNARPAAADGAVAITVRDHGPGFGDLSQEQLFQPFRPGRSSTGMGLGLSIVAELVVANGGRIKADDADGGGACFVVHLPVPTNLVVRRDTSDDGASRGTD